MKKPFRLTSRGAESRRYSLGTNPCGNCQSYDHDRCRPKLDGTLCSCNCVRAQIANTQFGRKADAARSAGAPIPTVAAALEILHPRYKQHFKPPASDEECVKGPVFYILRPFPRDLYRLKMGYSSCLPKRLRDHRVTCPDLRTLRSYPCARKQEATALWTLMHLDCVRERVGPEVVDVIDTLQFLQSADEYFGSQLNNNA